MTLWLFRLGRMTRHLLVTLAVPGEAAGLTARRFTATARSMPACWRPYGRHLVAPRPVQLRPIVARRRTGAVVTYTHTRQYGRRCRYL
jgi:hypothetical protein